MSFAGKKTGGEGEDLAEAHLAKKGYQILRRNFVTKVGEIDIIAQDGETVVFVEVKTFGDNSWEGISPAVNVTVPKQKKIILVARQVYCHAGQGTLDIASFGCGRWSVRRRK